MEATTLSYTAILLLVPMALAYTLSKPTGLVKWVQKKNYQYEVTFSLYMLTPTEKFVFNSILFLTVSMFLLASIVYLPDHVMTMSRRTYYYFAGDAALMSSSRQAAETLYGSATEWAQTAYQAAMNITTPAVSQEAVESVKAAVAESSATAASVAAAESVVAAAREAIPVA